LAEEYAQFGIGWIEEPLRADRPIEERLRVAKRSSRTNFNPD
jgi:hypothetical protein